ncbi:MAG: hypothetical protein AAF204_02965 [Pseudomonadota bacterium]
MSDEANTDDEITLSAEMMDRAERKALKKKIKEEEAAKKAQRTPEEIEAALKRSKLAEAQKKKRKKQFKYGLLAALAAFLSWGVYYLFKPYQAGPIYGVCRTFLELQVQFPQDLRISTVEDMGMSARIWYTQLDAFGEYRMESIHCFFRQDDALGAALERVTINRRDVNSKVIEAFNPTIPIVLANPPDLTIPYPLPDSLQNLQINTDAFRFQLNLDGP